jgi:hypothetical protein
MSWDENDFGLLAELVTQVKAVNKNLDRIVEQLKIINERRLD